MRTHDDTQASGCTSHNEAFEHEVRDIIVAHVTVAVHILASSRKQGGRGELSSRNPPPPQVAPTTFSHLPLHHSCDGVLF